MEENIANKMVCPRCKSPNIEYADGMTMEDWARRIDAYLSSDERPLLDNDGCVSHEEAVLHAETEFEKFRIIQDRLYRSDFDRYLSDLTFIEGPEE